MAPPLSLLQTRPPANFDSLAGIYRGLEYAAFGRDLERARECLADRLAGCRSVLIFGEGDGRFLAKLVRIAPAAAIDCVDASGAMIARARARIPPGAELRVRFQQSDATVFQPAERAYDAAVTLFFLDCFTEETAARIVGNIAASLRPGGLWLFADFAVPPRGQGRLQGRLWLALLYAFFRWRTGIEARSLPPSEALIEAAGFRRIESRELRNGLLHTVLFRTEAR